jgi:hypothetical protein
MHCFLAHFLGSFFKFIFKFQARAIIALSPDGMDPDEADSRMVRQV